MHGIEILFILVLVAFAQGMNSTQFSKWQSSWITGGSEAAPGEFPYMALLRLGDEFCGGAIIRNSHILTAAHCVTDLPVSSITVVVGQIIIRRTNARFEVARVIIYPGYDPVTKENDIALLRLTKSIVYTPTVVRIPLPQQGEQVPVGTQCVITGWGYVEGSGARPGYLQKLPVNIISNSEAQPFCNPVYDTDICTMAGPGKGTSLGDSGGPLVCGRKLIGTLSGSVERTCRSDRVSVYAGVSNYVNWILQNFD